MPNVPVTFTLACTMGAELFLLVCLAGLAIFILWEGWQRRRPAPLQRQEMARGFTPGEANREVVWFTVAFACGVAGWAILQIRPAPPFTGRGALMLAFIHTHFGSGAFAVLLWVAAAGALAAGFNARRRRRLGKESARAS